MSNCEQCPSSKAGSCAKMSAEDGISRRTAIGSLLGGVAATAMATASVSASGLLSDEEERKMGRDEFDEYFKRNYRQMTETEKAATVDRLEKKTKEVKGKEVNISSQDARPGTLFGYAFNLSRCNGSRKCIEACRKENNADRSTNMEYIRLLQMDKGKIDLSSSTADYDHAEPPTGKFWLGTQCHQCENPACVKVCPTGATWKEADGIVVIDYDWCVGCRYCQAACPYWARRFNWQEPEIDAKDINPNQHYLGNRLRPKGAMEKCTFCIQRTRKGENPACADACPTGARVFGNLLDPDSELRYILAQKKVFRLKEDLGTDPKFWYFMD